MTDETTPPAGETPKPKRTRGPRRRADNTVTLTQDQFAELLSRIKTLESEVADGERIIVEGAAVPSAPAAEPGSYFNVGTEAAPNVHKRRWSKTDIERRYEMVPLRPMVTQVFSPHGVPYQLNANVDTTVPSIVRTLHDEYVRSLEVDGKRYRNLTFAENVALAEQAIDQPGHQVWSRLFRRAGSLFMNPAEPAQETEAEQKA